MPTYMDVHEGMHGIDAAGAIAAHQADLKVQDKHGVKFIRYWFDSEAGKVFCLSEAPNAEAAKAVHAEAGHPAQQIFEVTEGS